MSNRATVHAMREHLGELAADMRADIEEGWPGFPGVTTARLVHGDPARVLIPTIRNRHASFDGLHEFGHLDALRTGDLRR